MYLKLCAFRGHTQHLVIIVVIVGAEHTIASWHVPRQIESNGRTPWRFLFKCLAAVQIQHRNVLDAKSRLSIPHAVMIMMRSRKLKGKRYHIAPTVMALQALARQVGYLLPLIIRNTESSCTRSRASHLPLVATANVAADKNALQADTILARMVLNRMKVKLNGTPFIDAGETAAQYCIGS